MPNPLLPTLNALADGAIAAACLVTAVLLYAFARRRADLPFRWIFLVFAAALAGGAGVHLATAFGAGAAVTLAFKVGTALVGVVTAVALIPLLPRALALRSHAALAGEVEQRRRAEAELARSERYYRGLFDHAHDAVLVIDLAGEVVLDVNPRACELYGYERKAFLGRSLLELSADPSTGHSYVGRTLGTAAAHRFETIQVRRDGRPMALEVCASAVEFEGRPAILSVNRDVTAEREAARRLLAETERYRAVVELAVDAIVTTDATGAIVGWNAAAERMFGHSTAEALGRDVALVMPDRFKGAHTAGMKKYEPGRPSNVVGRAIEIVARRRDGAEFPVELTVAAWAADGTRFFTAILRDVSVRKQAQAAVELRDRAIEALTQGVCITDSTRPDNPIVHVNHGFELLTGYTRAEVVGKNCRFLQGPDTDQARVEQVRQAIRTGTSCQVELVNYRKDGSKFINALSVNPVRDAAGTVTHFVAGQTDMTPFRKLEDQFRQAQKMQAVGHLAGGVAHDFNNLLTVINGYSEVLLGSAAADGPEAPLLTEVLAAGNRAADLTRQLLSFSRKQIIQPQVIDLNDLVANIQKMLTRLIGEDVRLTTALDPAAGRVRADPGQMEQVLLNLAVNARDAMPQGGRLTIETDAVLADATYAQSRPQVAPGRYTVLAVTDTGCGMTPEVKARLFEPFFTTKGVGKGTGLGLATVYGIVQQFNGFVFVYSEVGKGTTFEVLLPTAEAPAGEAIPDSVAGPVGGKETVLLVEDEPGVRGLTSLALRGGGYTVLEASGGADADRVRAAHPGPINLLLTDVVMPDVGGRQVAEALRAKEPGLKVVFMSGYTDDAIVRHGVLEAEVAFLHKPFTVAGLLRKVRTTLDGGGRLA